MPIQLPDNIKPTHSVFTSDFEYVSLPFPFMRLSWHNGNPHASKNEGPKHFGGFQRGSKEVNEDLEKMGLPSLPGYFTESDWISDNGNSYKAWGARALFCAPILAKVDWYVGKDKKTGEVKKKHRLDFLVYLADLENKNMIPWGPAVITSYGNAASEIEKSFKTFATDTKAARGEFANGADVEFFYHNVGSFGGERVTRPAGDSVIVCCKLNQPKEWTEAHLENFFVGEEIAAVIVGLQGEADAWNEDTNANRQKKNAGGAQNVTVQFGSLPPENFVQPPEDDGSFPF